MVKHTNNYTNKNTENDPENDLKNGVFSVCAKTSLNAPVLGFLTFSLLYLVPEGEAVFAPLFLKILPEDPRFSYFGRVRSSSHTTDEKNSHTTTKC